MDQQRFLEASEKGNLIPLYKCILSDHLTPVLAYRCLVKEDDRETPSFIFESVDPGFRESSVVRKTNQFHGYCRFILRRQGSIFHLCRNVYAFTRIILRSAFWFRADTVSSGHTQ